MGVFVSYELVHMQKVWGAWGKHNSSFMSESLFLSLFLSTNAQLKTCIQFNTETNS